MSAIKILEEQVEINNAIRAISEARAKRQKEREQQQKNDVIFRGKVITIAHSDSETATANNNAHDEDVSELETQELHHWVKKQPLLDSRSITA